MERADVGGFTGKPGRNRRLRRTAMAAAAGLIVAFGLTAVSADGVPQASNATDEPGVSANLWEWNWHSVATECTDVLGPSGLHRRPGRPAAGLRETYRVGQRQRHDPPSLVGGLPGGDYNLTSRMGSENEFKAMVKACRKAGVKVYVDAVINHTTGQGNISYGGVATRPTTTPAGYGPDDFHFTTGECPSSDGGIHDFNNKPQVFNCNLVGLEDLRTETDYVQSTLAAYLNKLIGYGVSGFRVDAAKHIGQDDLDAIYSQLHRTKDGVKPYWALEVFGGGPGILSPQAFTSSGDVLGLGRREADPGRVQELPSRPRRQHRDARGLRRRFGSDRQRQDALLRRQPRHRAQRDALNYKDGARSSSPTSGCWRTATAPRRSSPASPGTDHATTRRRPTRTG